MAIVLVFLVVCLFLLLYTNLYCTSPDQLCAPLAGSEGLNPSILDHGFLNRQLCAPLAGSNGLNLRGLDCGFLCHQSANTLDRGFLFRQCQLCAHLAGSEGLNPSILDRGFLCRQSVSCAMITLAIITVSSTLSGSSSVTRASNLNEEFEFGEEVHQCISNSKFAAATQNFSDSNILYEGLVYKIYYGDGARLSTSRAPSPPFYLSYTPYDALHRSHLSHPFIIYKGKYLPNDRFKLERLSHLNHPNLAPMLDYSCNARDTVVGYNNKGARLLIQQLSCNYISWRDRLNICIGAAEALGCLHSARIFYGGIYPTTILVDDNYPPKLVTFGYVLSHLPQHISRSIQPTEKIDIYFFGLLLVIVLCGNRTDYWEGYPFRLPNKVIKAVKDKTLHEITDLTLAEIRNESAA